MTCEICSDDYGISLCENDCSYLMCSDCINKLESLNCPQCRGILNIKLFVAGKITTNHPDQYTRRFVLKSEYEDFGEIKDNLRHEKCGNITINDEDIIDYDDFINLEQELPIQQIIPTTALTGPYIIVDDSCEPQHGYWQSSDYADVKPISDIVNKRNHQAIVNCDVFVLKLNIMYDCFRSIAEWGIASALGKTLIILFPDEEKVEKELDYIDTSDLDKLLKDHVDYNMKKTRQKEDDKDVKERLVKKFIKNKSDKMQSEFYMFAAESIKTLDKLSFTKREAIFTSHPIFNITYKEYVKNLKNIISKKRPLQKEEENEE
tara:strand:- start:228 stop:1184 length:957 start_codon:yes stop_codon:yes gene_type:complete